jgi:hypothetical protein
MPTALSEKIINLTPGGAAQPADLVYAVRDDDQDVSLTAEAIAALGGSPEGTDGAIQFNDNGLFSGSSATIDEDGNIVDLDGLFTFGSLSALPEYLQSLIYPGLNSVNAIVPAGFGNGDIGAVLQTGGYCSDLATYIIGMSTSVASPCGSYGNYTQAVVASSSSDAVASGYAADVFAEDATVAGAYLFGSFFGVWNNGGTVSAGAAIDIAVGQNVSGRGTGPSGIQFGAALYIEGVSADPSTGEAIGIYVFPESNGSDYGINGATRYFIKSRSTAPSVLSGPMEVTALSLSILPPTYADNAEAVDGGLSAGEIYRTGSDPDFLCIVH